MKKYLIVLVSLLFVLASFSGCGEVASVDEHPDATISTTLPADVQPALTVTQEIWKQTFSEEGLATLLENYTVTNVLAESYWDTAVTPSRVSRLAKDNTDALLAGAILANGDNGVIQFVFHKETGWQQGTYGETDTVEQYVTEITQDLTETLQVLSTEFGNAVWNEEKSAYAVEVEIPYDGPSLADPAQETPTLLTFEVFFVDGNLLKINIIDGESLAVVHSFGTTPVPQLPDA